MVEQHEYPTTRAVIELWFKDGVTDGHDFMIIVCDQFDYGDFPSFASDAGVKRRVERFLTADLTDVHEVYDLSMDMDDQLNEKRAWHLPDGSEPPPRKGSCLGPTDLELSCGHDLNQEILQTFNAAAPQIFRCPKHGIVTFKQT